MTLATTTAWPGGDLTGVDYDLMVRSRIDEAHIEADPEARSKCWFDYRLMHPAKATYLYAAEYVKAYKDCYQATRDIRTVDVMEPFTPDDVFRSKEAVPMWLARQAADSLGIRYEFVLRFVMNRFANRGWRHFPRPNHLYAEEMLLDLNDEWKIECAGRLQLPQNPFYRNEKFANHRYQNEWHIWIINQIRKRSVQHLGLATVVYKEKLLPESKAIEYFGSGVLDRARQFAVLLT